MPLNLLGALEKKNTLESIIQERIGELSLHIDDRTNLSVALAEIDSLVDSYFSLERQIQKKYEITMVSTTETIADVVSYAESLSLKAKALKALLLSIHKFEIEQKGESCIDKDHILLSIEKHEDLRNNLIKKIRDVCFKTNLDP